MNPRLRVGADGLGRLVFDDPVQAHNILDADTFRGLAEAVGVAEAEAASGRLRALEIASAKPGSFIAGADVNAIAALADAQAGEEASRRGQALFARVAALPAPVVASIRGVCLGGGAELALACHFRVAADDEGTRIGFPEVSLGILPGWGGTARLPGVVGLRAALELALSGKPASAAKAGRIGLVDRVFPASQFERRAGEFARRLAAGGAEPAPAGAKTRRRPGRTRARAALPPGEAARTGARTRRRRGLGARILDGTPFGRALVLSAARRQVVRRTGGRYPAPLKIVEVFRRGAQRSLRRRFDLEARAVGELAASQVCRNLIFLFRMRERARKGPWSEDGVAAPVGRAAVVGAGVMGGGIAQSLAYRDVPVRLKDVAHEAVSAGLAASRALFDEAVKRRRLRRRDADRKMALVSGGVTYAGVSRADLVIEAVVERMDAKRAVLREIEAVVGRQTVVVTNTSSLSVDEMAAALDRPERFAGMHFFNPVHRMPLVEVVRGARTSASTLETVAALAVRLGKTPVVTADSPGFLVNRILAPFLNEAGHLLDEGWDARAVDAAWKAFGAPMGPYRLMDEVGIDVVRHAGETMASALGGRMTPAPALVALGRTDRLGRKGGRGFYVYRTGKPDRFDASVYADAGLRSSRSAPAAKDVQDRLVLAMINEAARVLEEGIAASAADVDLAMVMGAGFPPFRGGLLKYADDRGAAAALSAATALRRRLGERYAPSSLLRRLGEAGETFHGAFPGE